MLYESKQTCDHFFACVKKFHLSYEFHVRYQLSSKTWWRVSLLTQISIREDGSLCTKWWTCCDFCRVCEQSSHHIPNPFHRKFQPFFHYILSPDLNLHANINVLSGILQFDEKITVENNRVNTSFPRYLFSHKHLCLVHLDTCLSLPIWGQPLCRHMCHVRRCYSLISLSSLRNKRMLINLTDNKHLVVCTFCFLLHLQFMFESKDCEIKLDKA